ncbi:MAG: methionine--tRNA ligase [Anaeroplasmataceae bacterium]
MNKKFYLTTAIAYTSSKPHIGNVYEAILSDAIVRYKRKSGYDVYFQTGTDEHGQKIEKKALDLNISPKEHVDNISTMIKDIYKSVDVSYDNFVRTTDKYHELQVQKAFKKLYEQGDIYKGSYEGWYCVDCESYYTEKDLVDGCCPDCGAKVSKAKEECYFLKLTTYQDRLINHIKTHPEFIQPESRKNEMLNNFLANPLPDLCVSRTSYKWGIPVDFDPGHVTYVWIDALMNYITGIGYDVDGNHGELYKKYWPADVHVIGKDILRFHTIYWPIILMALGVELPHQVFGHPWVLMNHNKMSKSKGNVIYTDDLIKFFGKDGVRYYVLSEIPFAQDGNLTYELVCEKYNSDLVNTLGNLVNRTIAMANKYFGGSVSYKGDMTEFDSDLKSMAIDTVNNVFKLMDSFKVSDSLEAIMKLLRRTNKYIDETAPWVLARDESLKDVLENVLYNILESIRISAVLLEAFLPQTAKDIYALLNTEATSYESITEFNTSSSYTVGEAKVLFKRLDLNKDVLDVVLASEKAKEKEEIAKPSKPEISIEDFDKVDLCVGEIIEANKHPKADKLLVFKVNIGREIRQIVSGIAKWYNPQDLVGKKVVVVKNLKPVVLRGVESQGMLLCAANDKDDLELLQTSRMPGDIVR